jgi:hypothetical protein
MMAGRRCRSDRGPSWPGLVALGTLLLCAGPAGAAPPPVAPRTTRYVAHRGSDSAAGTIAAPWRTLRHALRQLRPGDTLFIRGSPASAFHTENDCASPADGCWTETDRCGDYGTCSPLHWVGGEGRPAGASDASRIRIAAYPGEVVIIQPSHGQHVVAMDPTPGAAACSFITFENLIFDGRNVSNNVFRIDPRKVRDDPSLHCSHNRVHGGKIRHGKFVAGVALVGSSWEFKDVEAYENGCQTSTGDHDHAYYIQGTHNRILGGSIHHNIHGVQVWNENLNGRGITGHNEFRGVDIGHNGFNPWCRKTRNGCGAELALYHDVGSHSTVDGCLVHDNTCGSIGLSGDWGPIPATHVTVTGNHVWNNGKDPIFIGNSYGNTIRDNVFAPPGR